MWLFDSADRSWFSSSIQLPSTVSLTDVQSLRNELLLVQTATASHLTVIKSHSYRFDKRRHYYNSSRHVQYRMQDNMTYTLHCYISYHHQAWTGSPTTTCFFRLLIISYLHRMLSILKSFSMATITISGHIKHPVHGDCIEGTIKY